MYNLKYTDTIIVH